MSGSRLRWIRYLALISFMISLAGSAVAQAGASRELGMRSHAAPAPPRIQFLTPIDFPRESGCAGSPLGDSRAVLAWGSPFTVMKINGAVRRLTLGKESEFPKAGRRRGDRLRQEWRAGSILVILDLVLASVCPPDDDRCDGSTWVGDLTVRARHGAEAESRKTIRIQIECGC